MNDKLMAVVLAAGKGTRLQSEHCDLPKVLRLAAGQPLLHYVLQSTAFVPKTRTVLVVGYKKEAVTAAFPDYPAAVQTEQLGTGHAVMAAADFFKDFDGSVLVCCGDMPLLTRETMEALWAAHRAEDNACTLLSGTTEKPLAYGRILRDAQGRFVAIREQKDCTEAEKQIRELNSGVYIFRAAELAACLSKLSRNNAQGEYYLTDVPAMLAAQGKKVGVCCRELGAELLGVNTVEQLEEAERLLTK